MNPFFRLPLASLSRYRNDSFNRPISFKPIAIVLAASSAAFALTAAAQTTPPLPASPIAPATAAPASHATPPALTFHSALDGYQPFVEEKAIPWKEANDTVYRRGGWRAYAKEAAAGSNDDAQPAGGADPHAGHSMPMPMPMPMPKKEQR